MTTSTSARFREWFVGVSVLAMLAALVVALPAGASSFSTEVINGSNGFDTGQEAFSTSTVADSGYTSYAVWDREDLYLGYTGSNVGQGDNDANPKEEGQGPEKYIVYYLDTDPYGDQGTTDAEEAGGQDWELPMQADYEILIRTDGETTADGGYTGVADVREWTGTEWSSIGDEPLHIWDNNGSNYIEFSVDLSQLDSPENVSVVSWFYDTEQDISYGYWPATTAEDGTANGTRLQDYYGFPLIDRQIPNASDEQANLNREWFGDQEYCFSDTFGSGPAEFAGTGDPFHSAKINGGNGFNSQDESFETSTVADTGYTSYATWDREKLFLGYTGSNVGGGDTDDPEADKENGQSPQRWINYYFDVDPTTSNGTTTAYTSEEITGSQSYTLPFRADYAVFIRTDGLTVDINGEAGHTGVLDMREWDEASGSWESVGPCAIQIFDNNTSGFLEFSVDMSDIGYPSQVATTSFFSDAQEEISYGYWPKDTAQDGRADGTTLQDYYGFILKDGQIPNQSANLNRPFNDLPPSQTTFNDYTVDGVAGNEEQLPAEFQGRNASSLPAQYHTWDDEAFSYSFDGGPITGGGEDLYVAFDADPAVNVDPREGEGRTDQPPTGATAQPTYPFAADVVYRFEGTVDADEQAQSPAPGERWVVNDEGEWEQTPMPEGTAIFRSPQDEGATEVRIPRSSEDGTSDIRLEDGSTESPYIHTMSYLIDDGNGIDQTWPTQNPTGSTPEFTHFRSWYVQQDVETFARQTLSARLTAGTTLADELYGNLYLVPSSAATFKLGAATTVVHELFIGSEAELDVTSTDFPLRFARHFTGVGEFGEQEGAVFTFPISDEFGAPESDSRICEGVSFHDLVARNETQFGCDDDGGLVTADSDGIRSADSETETGSHRTGGDIVGINGTFELRSIIDTGTFDLVIGPDGGLVGGGPDAYLRGSLVLESTQAQPRLQFPLGDTAYRPVVLRPETGTTDLTAFRAEVVGEAAPRQDQVRRPLKDVSDVRYWEVEQVHGPAVDDARVQVRWGADSGVTQPRTLRLAQSLGDEWFRVGKDLTPPSRTTIAGTVDTLVAPSQFTLGTVSNGRKQNPLR